MKLYTIGALAKLTGVKVKTIRYYDEIDLLKPTKINEAGYRLYALEEARRLQYIMTFRLMNFTIADIRQILLGEIKIEQAAQIQIKALSRQIASLDRIRAILTRACADKLLESPAAIIQIGEELRMNEEQQRELLIEKLCDVTFYNCTSAEWRASSNFKDHIQNLGTLKLDTKEKIDAFHELVILVNDPEFITEYKTSMSDFWEMVDENNISLTTWSNAMDELFGKKVQQALKKRLVPSSIEAQQLVQEWMQIIAKNINRPIDAKFKKIFKEKIAAMTTAKQFQFRKLMKIIQGKKHSFYEALKFMVEALECDS